MLVTRAISKPFSWIYGTNRDTPNKDLGILHVHRVAWCISQLCVSSLLQESMLLSVDEIRAYCLFHNRNKITAFGVRATYLKWMFIVSYFITMERVGVGVA